MTLNTKSRWALIVLVILLAPAGWAQRVNPIGPEAPIGEDEESSSKRMEEPEPEPAEPDTRPLGGAESFSLGGLLEGRKYFRYGVSFSQRMNGVTGGSSANLSGTSNLNASFELRRALPRSELFAIYRGGALVNTEAARANTFHSLSVRQRWQKGRWNFQLGDQLLYSPDSPYALTVGGQLLNVVVNFSGQSSTNPIFIPGQQVLSGRTSRLGNSTVGQVQYHLGPRTSVFATAGYGFLRFTSSRLSDFDQRNVLLGIDRRLTSSDSIGVSYGFGQFHFSRGGSNINTHTLRGAYGRRLTSRMALEVSGGPQISFFRDPLLGPRQRLFWTAHGGLHYNWGSSQLGLSYQHDLNGGSGVLAGSQGDSVYLSWTRPVRRSWNMNLGFGYSRNQGIRAFTTSALRPTFDTTYASVMLSRRLGSDRSLYVSYNANHQLDRGGNGFPLHHALEVGLSWNPRSHRID
ncbi:MAG: hypothetical protein L0099_02310 [Acidobacteria bacterium]|nr:hypothetical protein [Acidobacteriota bacterium]